MKQNKLNLLSLVQLIGIITVLLIYACKASYQESKTERIKLANNVDTTQPIVIGIAWSDENSNFVKGAKLAETEINEQEGKILNRELKLIINDNEKVVNSLKLRLSQHVAVNVANQFAKNPQIVAVIGHKSSDLAIPASIVYKNHGIVFLAPTATNLNLTSHNFNYVFRLTPHNEEIGKQLASYSHKLGYQNMIILHDRGSYAIELADSFIYNAIEIHNINIVLRRSFFSHREYFTDILVELKRSGEFDAIFISTNSKVAAQIYQKSRDMNIMVPFIGGDALDSEIFWKTVQEWEGSEGSEIFTKKTIVPTIFNPNISVETTQKFIKEFSDKNQGKQADRMAALGYDAVKLLEHAIKKAKSTEPLKIAETLRYMQYCQAAGGQYKFQINGDVFNKTLFFKFFKNKQFEYDTVDGKPPITLEECGKVDQDKDNIPNNLDNCPNNNATEISKGVYKNGTLRGCPIDNDNDKVPDYRDDCPNNTTKEISKGVDSRGCPIDSDTDKLHDYHDDCPNNTAKEISKGIDLRGCPIDSDTDKVPDYRDDCPNNITKEISKGVDLHGCPIDSDTDKLHDYHDDCPNNTAKEISKGIDLHGCPIDSDNDKVPDYRDDCPNNIAKEMSKGVSLRGCPIDKDNDKVPDYRDNCPSNTSIQISKGVDLHGCPIDSDNDAVLDYRDNCLNNTAKEINKGIDLDGCPIDNDNDKVSDYHDYCPNNTSKEISKGVDLRGCPIDTDNDAVPDYRDDCPNNITKEISKGIDLRGCPIDSDNDKVSDYHDYCPNNSTKEISKGVDLRGCPIDSDNDAVPDYRDNCPNDSNFTKEAVNSFGCLIDLDQDGVPNYKDLCEGTPRGIAIEPNGCPVIIPYNEPLYN